MFISFVGVVVTPQKTEKTNYHPSDFTLANLFSVYVFVYIYVYMYRYVYV